MDHLFQLKLALWSRDLTHLLLHQQEGGEQQREGGLGGEEGQQGGGEGVQCGEKEKFDTIV